MRPTPRGAALLEVLAQPEVCDLVGETGGIMRWPGEGLRAAILLQLRHLASRERPADQGPLPPSDGGDTPGHTRSDPSADPAVLPATGPGRTSDSDEMTTAGDSDAKARRWAALAR